MRGARGERVLRALVAAGVALIGMSALGAAAWEWSRDDGAAPSVEVTTSTAHGVVPDLTTTSTSVVLADRVAFFGDSLAVDLGDAAKAHVAADATTDLDVASNGITGCGVARSGRYRLGGTTYATSPICARWAVTWLERIDRDRPKLVVLQLGRHEVLDRELDGTWSNILDPRYAAYVRDELEHAVRIASARGARVVLLTSPVFHQSGRPEDDPARVARFNQLLESIDRTNEAVTLVDLGRHVSPNGMYAPVIDGIKIRSDGVHFTQAGATWAIAWLLPQLILLEGAPR